MHVIGIMWYLYCPPLLIQSDPKMDLINKNKTVRDPEVWRSPLSLPTVHHSVRRPSVLKPIVSFYQNIFYVLLFLLFTYSILSHPSLVITEEDEDGNKYLFCVAVAHMTDSEMFIVFCENKSFISGPSNTPMERLSWKKGQSKNISISGCIYCGRKVEIRK